MDLIDSAGVGDVGVKVDVVAGVRDQIQECA
jgi:hypothetical protein